ncbi:hypothetical protein CLW00_108124 [Mongoliibacter ruber]|uniref:Uncharacterized protein n=1 Tax=Mongoliibacter ruber TaxID=1750599 RepID=A0A2T0WIW7_9BACT|nr:hypothetical protein CLW00_108124 [Mongoliibacter ruber]
MIALNLNTVKLLNQYKGSLYSQLLYLRKTSSQEIF